MKPRNTIFVRNNGILPMSSRYDGEDFTIEPGEYIEMEIPCAELVFGFGDDNKMRAISRLGWSKTNSDIPACLERLNSFSFHMNEQEAKGHFSAPVGSPSMGEPVHSQEKAVSKQTRGKSRKVVAARPTNALQKLATVNTPAS